MPARILIVEDERITAEDLHDILIELDYQVTAIVSSGAEAIQEAEKNPPDLALMDIRIKGDIDGTETARVLGERFNIPVVYLTAHADRETLQRAKRAKPLGYLVKPFQESELQASIEIALHRHNQDHVLRQQQQHLTDVLSSIIMGVISVNELELVLLFNPAAANLTGYAQPEVLGQPVRKVLRLADVRSGNAMDLPLAQVLGENRLADLGQVSLITKDGQTLSIVGNIAPLRDPGGRAIGATVVFEEAVSRHPGEPFLESKYSSTEQGSEIQFGRFYVVAQAPEMRRVLAFAQRVARSEATTILLEGESGTGKDLLARFMHYSSVRRAGPFIPVNCAAIPENMIESELFGHERGAFAQAQEAKKGLFEMADGGTLYLDEVSGLSPAVQAKLLRVLDDQSFRHLGSTEDIRVNIRVIAATNRGLAEQVASGQFRLDLFHRLTVIQISIPPLRERTGDILPLARHFIDENRRHRRTKIDEISPEAARILTGHPWPGNVRELRNVIERAILVEETNVLRPASVHFVSVATQGIAPVSPAAPPGDNWSLKQSEQELVLRALEKAGGNQTKAAKLLGITRDMLRYRMKRLQAKVTLERATFDKIRREKDSPDTIQQ